MNNRLPWYRLKKLLSILHFCTFTIPNTVPNMHYTSYMIISNSFYDWKIFNPLDLDTERVRDNWIFIELIHCKRYLNIQ